MPASDLGPGAEMSSPANDATQSPPPTKSLKQNKGTGGPQNRKTNKNPWEKAAPLVHGPSKQRASKQSIWHLVGLCFNMGIWE